MALKFASLLVFLTASVFAQSAGGLAGISGVVRDPSGAFVPNAKIVITNDTKGVARKLTSNESGLFSAPALTPASGYKVTVSAPGFTGYEVQDMVLQVGQNVDSERQAHGGPGYHGGGCHSRGAAGGRHQNQRRPGDRFTAD